MGQIQTARIPSIRKMVVAQPTMINKGSPRAASPDTVGFMYLTAGVSRFITNIHTSGGTNTNSHLYLSNYGRRKLFIITVAAGTFYSSKLVGFDPFLTLSGMEFSATYLDNFYAAPLDRSSLINMFFCAYLLDANYVKICMIIIQRLDRR